MRLIAENLGGERGGFTVFSKIGFTLGNGDALMVTGPNGVGKSTLLRVIAGLLPLAAGTLRLEDPDDSEQTVMAAAHYLGHHNAMKPTLTVSENLAFWRSFNGASQNVAEALDMVGLGEIGYLPYSVLSTGQRRRTAIARLLVSHRPIWLLDEPTSGLDAASERKFSSLMKDHLGRGGIIIAATHLPLGLDNAAELRMER